MAESMGPFESRIFELSGATPWLHHLVAGHEDRDRWERAGQDELLSDGGQEPERDRRESGTCGKHYVAAAALRSGAHDVLARRDSRGDARPALASLDLLLRDDRIGPGRAGGAGHDLDTRAVVGANGRSDAGAGLSAHGDGPAGVDLPDCEAVHRRSIEGGVIAIGRDGTGKD